VRWLSWYRWAGDGRAGDGHANQGGRVVGHRGRWASGWWLCGWGGRVVGVPGSGSGRVEVVGEVVVGKRVVGERMGDVLDAGIWSSGGLRWSRGWWSRWSMRAGGGQGGRVE
jgi:hypothetical protein